MNKTIKFLIAGVVFILLLLTVVFFIKTRGPEEHQEPEELYITVSIPPLKYIAERITGGEIPVNVILPPGSAPETYEPTPRSLKKLEKSPVIFVIGLIDFESTVTERVAGKSKVVKLAHSVTELIYEGHDHHSHHGHNHSHSHGVDPHIWSSPECLQLMAADIFAAFPPELMKEEYIVNYENLIWDITELDHYIIDKLHETGVKSFMIYHPALTYFARDYGLDQLQLEYDGKEPTADKLKSTIERAKAEGLNKILYQKEFSVKAVESVAKELSATPVAIDPLAEDVISNLREITDIIAGTPVNQRYED